MQRGDLARENTRFVGQPGVGEVARQEHEVGGFRELGEEDLERAL